MFAEWTKVKSVSLNVLFGQNELATRHKWFEGVGQVDSELLFKGYITRCFPLENDELVFVHVYSIYLNKSVK